MGFLFQALESRVDKLKKQYSVFDVPNNILVWIGKGRTKTLIWFLIYYFWLNLIIYIQMLINSKFQ